MIKYKRGNENFLFFVIFIVINFIFMLELNKIHLCNCMDGLKQLDDNSIDVVITSPPYNKGDKKRSSSNLWNSSINYADYDDNMEENEYQEWQIELCNELFRVLKPGGSLFYNHKLRTFSNVGILPSVWLNKTKFTMHQLIVWDRMGSVNVNTGRFLPTTELIYWMTKGSENIRFSRQTYQLESGKNRGQIVPLTEVWQVKADMNNEHPAPYPVELIDRIIPSVLAGGKDNIIVLDPFMGSGTTAISAKKHGCNWIGFEMSEKYLNMAYKRIDNYFADQTLGENIFGEEVKITDDFSFEEMKRKQKEEMNEKHKVKNQKNKPVEKTDSELF